MASEKDRALLSQARGRAAHKLPAGERAAFIGKQGGLEEKHQLDDTAFEGLQNEANQVGALPDPDPQPPPPQQAQAAPSYHRGTKFVKRTGPAILQRGEAVVPKRKAAAMRRGRSQFFGE